MSEKTDIKRVLEKDLCALRHDTRDALSFSKSIDGSGNLAPQQIDKALWHIENVVDDQFGFTDTLRIAHEKGLLIGWMGPAEDQNDFLSRVLNTLYFANRASYILSGQLVCARIRQKRHSVDARMAQ